MPPNWNTALNSFLWTHEGDALSMTKCDILTNFYLLLTNIASYFLINLIATIPSYHLGTWAYPSVLMGTAVSRVVAMLHVLTAPSHSHSTQCFCQRSEGNRDSEFT